MFQPQIIDPTGIIPIPPLTPTSAPADPAPTAPSTGGPAPSPVFVPPDPEWGGRPPADAGTVAYSPFYRAGFRWFGAFAGGNERVAFARCHANKLLLEQVVASPTLFARQILGPGQLAVHCAAFLQKHVGTLTPTADELRDWCRGAQARNNRMAKELSRVFGS